MDKSEKSALKSPSSFASTNNLKGPSAFRTHKFDLPADKISTKDKEVTNTTFSTDKNPAKATGLKLTDLNSKFSDSKHQNCPNNKKRNTLKLDTCHSEVTKKPNIYFLSPSMLQNLNVVKNLTEKNLLKIEERLSVKAEEKVKERLTEVSSLSLLNEQLLEKNIENIDELAVVKKESEKIKEEMKMFMNESENVVKKENERIKEEMKMFMNESENVVKKENERIKEEMKMFMNESENEKKRHEKNSVQKSIEQLERKHFQEIKSIYEKYIALQNDRDNEKRDFERKILKYEETFREKDNKIHNQQCLLAEKDLKIKLNENCISKLQLEYMALDEELKNVNVSHEKEILLKSTEKETQILENKNQIELLQTELAQKTELLKNMGEKIMEEEKSLEKLKIKQNEVIDKKVSELTEELNKHVTFNEILETDLKTKAAKIFDLEKQIAEYKMEKSSSTLVAEKFQSLVNDNLVQHQEINQLKQTCKLLQSTNELLNVQLNALNEILRLQEENMTSVGSSENKILNLWRNKVYSLLVQLKFNHIN